LQTNTNTPEGYIPDCPPPPKVELVDHLPELTALGEPTFSSLGLAASNPAGYMQAMLEFFHVSLDLPWYACICGTALALRIILLPLYIRNRRDQGRIANFTEPMKRIQEKAKEARDRGDLEASES